MRQNNKWHNLLRGIFYVAVLFFLYEFGEQIKLKSSLQRQAQTFSPNKTIDDNKELEPFEAESDEELGDVLLLDSIMSIVQSFYVDSDRVSNYSLLEMTLKQLQRDKYLRLYKNKQRIVIKANGSEYRFFAPYNIQYESLLEIVVTLSHFIETTSKEPKLVSGNKKINGTEIVINALMSSLDAHSVLMSKESYRELRQGTEGNFGGLGVMVAVRDQVLTVIKPIKGSPAYRSGISDNDKILSINGIDTYGYTLDGLVEYMRGEPGTLVQLDVLKSGASSPIKVNLKREIIQVDSVTPSVYQYDKGEALVLEVESFASRTSQEIANALLKFKESHGGVISGLILDLRSNPGGLLDQAVQVADLFLESGIIVKTKGRRQEVERAVKGYDFLDFPITVLINSDTASASEIVAGALQDHNRAVVIGQPSFGKGSVQTIFELPNERALKLTIARYYTPLDRSIQNVGIRPDIWLQPIFSSEKNTNLLGDSRYRNENFLSNHLQAIQLNKESSLPVPHGISGFYLTEKKSANGVSQKDRILELAGTIISESNKKFGFRLDKNQQNARSWMEASKKKINSKIKSWTKVVKDKLKDEFNIVWNIPYESKPLVNLDLSIDTSNLSSVSSGSVLKVPYKISNLGTEPVDLMSLFVRSPQYSFGTKETLLGHVNAKESLSGQLLVEIPPYYRRESLDLDVGMAVSAIPLSTKVSSLEVNVIKKSMAKINTSFTIVNEVGGSVAGALEANESAEIKVRITNISDVEAKGLSVLMHNLSGKQIELTQNERSIQSIAPGDFKDVRLKIKGSDFIVDEDLDLGLSIDSPDLRDAVRKKIVVAGIKTNGGMPNELMSH